MATMYTPLVDGQPGRAATFNAVFQEFEDAIAARQGAFVVRKATTALTVDTPTITMDLASQDYPTLLLVASLRSKSASVDNLRIRFNGDAASTYTPRWVYVDASVTTASTSNVGSFDLDDFVQSDSAGAGQYGWLTLRIQLAHLASAKLIDFDAGRDATPKLWWGSGQWPGNAALTQITLSLSSGSNFATGSTYALYGTL